MVKTNILEKILKTLVLVSLSNANCPPKGQYSVAGNNEHQVNTGNIDIVQPQQGEVYSQNWYKDYTESIKRAGQKKSAQNFPGYYDRHSFQSPNFSQYNGNQLRVNTRIQNQSFNNSGYNYRDHNDDGYNNVSASNTYNNQFSYPAQFQQDNNPYLVQGSVVFNSDSNYINSTQYNAQNMDQSYNQSQFQHNGNSQPSYSPFVNTQRHIQQVKDDQQYSNAYPYCQNMLNYNNQYLAWAYDGYRQPQSGQYTVQSTTNQQRGEAISNHDTQQKQQYSSKQKSRKYARPNLKQKEKLAARELLGQQNGSSVPVQSDNNQLNHRNQQSKKKLEQYDSHVLSYYINIQNNCYAEVEAMRSNGRWSFGVPQAAPNNAAQSTGSANNNSNIDTIAQYQIATNTAAQSTGSGKHITTKEPAINVKTNPANVSEVQDTRNMKLVDTVESEFLPEMSENSKNIIRAIVKNHKPFAGLTVQECSDKEMSRSMKNYSGARLYLNGIQTTLIELKELWCYLSSSSAQQAAKNYVNPIIEACIKDFIYNRYKDFLESLGWNLDHLLNTIINELTTMSRTRIKGLEMINTDLNTIL